MESEYVDALLAAHRGELAGVAVSEAMASGRFGQDPAHGEVIRILGGVEARTRDLLAELLAESGVADVGATAPSADYPGMMDGQDWAGANAQLLRGLRELSRPLYAQIQELAPKPIDPRLAAVLHHVDVVEALLAGEVAGASDLDPARAYLDQGAAASQ